MRTSHQQNAINVIRGWTFALGGRRVRTALRWQAVTELKDVVKFLEELWPVAPTSSTIITWHSPMPQGFSGSGYGFSDEHPAYDIAPALGVDDDRCYPIKDGVVVWADWDQRPVLANNPTWDRGLYVVVDHGGGEESRYCHSRELLVVVGQLVVGGGTPLGYMGATGYAHGKHWHIGFTKGGRPVDWMREAGWL